MIRLRDVSFGYAHASAPDILTGVDLDVGPGEVVVLTGPSGCGKTTVTRLLNGLAPHFHPGTLGGDVTVAGISPSEAGPAGAAERVGSVFQNPRTQFFTVDVASELAFAAENLGHSPGVIVERLNRVAEELGLVDVLARPLFALSGGQKQKVACGSVWVARPKVLVLDEPSSNLDAATMDDLRRLIGSWKEAGCSIVIAEHRLHYLRGVADRWILLDSGRIVRTFDAAAMDALTTEDAAALGLRTPHPPQPPRIQTVAGADELPVVIRGFRRTYRGASRPSLDIEELRLPRSGVVAVVGANGAGKSTFARGLVGLDRRLRGTLEIDGAVRRRRHRLETSFLVMQDVNHQLFTESVIQEVALSAPQATPDELRAIVGALDLDGVADRHPMSLSGGQKQRVAVACAIASDADIVVFDEPTSGLDRRHMLAVAAHVRRLAARGRLVVLVTHDVELIDACATYLVEFAGGSVVRSGTVVHGLQEFGPQPADGCAEGAA